MDSLTWKFDLQANGTVNVNVNIAQILPNFLACVAVLFQAHTYSDAGRSVGIGSHAGPSSELLFGCDVGYVVYLEKTKSIASCVVVNPSTNWTVSGRIWATLLMETGINK